MRRAYVAIAIAVLCIVGGFAAGGLTLARLLGRGGFPSFGSAPAPAVVRTDPARIRPFKGDRDALFQTARSLAPGQVAAMRRRLEGDPGDVRTRILLLDYGMLNSEAEGVDALHNEQVVWFAANLPASPVLRAGEATIYPVGNGPTERLVQRLLDEAIAKKPNDPDLLTAAAAFTSSGDTAHKLALLAQAAALDPGNPDRHDRLAFAHVLAAHRYRAEDDPEESRLAVDAYLKAKALGGSVQPKYFFAALLASGRLDLARREAEASLRTDEDADSVHAAHTALGLLALRGGDVSAARGHLLASAKVEGSPVLGSFGPEMTLAKALLDHGDRDTVLAYLRATAKFWTDARQTRWTQTLADGGTPDWD